MTWYESTLTIVGNALTTYLVNKHLIKGVYEKHIEKRILRGRKRL